MDDLDYRGAIVAELKRDGSRKYTGKGKVPSFTCIRPDHNDGTPSAWIGDHAWGCMACGFEESLYTLGEYYGIERPQKSHGLTVEEYADRKGFLVDKLTKWGLRTVVGRFGSNEIVIPYYDADGVTVLRTKIRTPKKTFWGVGDGTYLYGLHQLAHSKPEKPVLLVEGESDCHAAWHGGVLAVGVPGADGFKAEWVPYFAGRDIYIWQEPDKGGFTFVDKLSALFPAARVIRSDLDVCKDVADLYAQTGTGFKEAMAHRMRTALLPGQKLARIPFDAGIGAALARLKIEKQKPIDAAPTPYATWNAACRGAGGGEGLARGWHVTLAANTGFGKSLISLNMAARGVIAGEQVTYVSLEMSPSESLTRYMAIMSGEHASRLDAGKWFDGDSFDRATRCIEGWYERSGGAIHCNRHSLSDLEDIIEGMQYQHEYNGSRYFIVDYLQLANMPGAKSDLERITKVSHAIRGFSAEHNVITVGVSQYNRETSKDRENPPTPQGLMGGSALENDSAQVLLLDHTTYAREESTQSARATLTLAKNRHGPQAKIPLVFNYKDLSIGEAPPVPVQPSYYEKSEADDSDGGDTSFDMPALELIS